MQTKKGSRNYMKSNCEICLKSKKELKDIVENVLKRWWRTTWWRTIIEILTKKNKKPTESDVRTDLEIFQSQKLW